MATDPFGLREMLIDAQDQTEEWNRAERQEHADARVDWDPRDEVGYPDAADIAEGREWGPRR